LRAGTLYRSVRPHGGARAHRRSPRGGVRRRRSAAAAYYRLHLSAPRWRRGREMRRISASCGWRVPAGSKPRTRVMRFYRALLRSYPAAFRAPVVHELGRLSSGRAEVDWSCSAVVRGSSFAALADVIPTRSPRTGRSCGRTRLCRAFAAPLRRVAVTVVPGVALAGGRKHRGVLVADFVLVRRCRTPTAGRLVKIWKKPEASAPWRPRPPTTATGRR